MKDPFYQYAKGLQKILPKDLGFCNKIIEKKQKEEEAKNILIGRQEDYLDLSGSREEMPYKDLLIKDNPNLETLIIDNCLLEKIKVVNCPNLKTLSCRHNYRITEIDVSECPSLEGLYCSNNKLEKLDLSQNINLKHLVCDNNLLKELEVKHLKNLESLHCFKNFLTELDCSNLSKLKELYCAHQNQGKMEGLMKTLNVQGCHYLHSLDAAENRITEINLSNLLSLNFVSLRLNDSLKHLNAENCQRLEFLDYTHSSHSFIKTIFSVADTRETALNLNGCINLKKIFAVNKSFLKYVDLNEFPKLELLQFSNKEQNIKNLTERQKLEKKAAKRASENGDRPNQKEKNVNKKKNTPKPNKGRSFGRKNKVNSEYRSLNNQIRPQSHQPTNYTPYLIGGGILVLGLLVVFSLIKFKKRKKI